MPQTAFGDYLDRLLERRGLTVAGFADILESTIAEIELIKATSLPAALHRSWMRVLRLSVDEENAFVYLAWSEDPQEREGEWQRLLAEAGEPRARRQLWVDPESEPVTAAAAAIPIDDLVRGL